MWTMEAKNIFFGLIRIGAQSTGTWTMRKNSSGS